MFAEIFQHTPTWVWVVFVMLISVGTKQLTEQRRSLRKSVLMSLAMGGVSLYGVAATFHGQTPALSSWMLGAVAVLALSSMLNAWSGMRWSHVDQSLVVPGSWVPLALFMSLFIIKFAVGVTLARHAGLIHQTMFESLVGLCYGAFSGVFLSRGLAMWRAGRVAGVTLATS
ncbi:MAG TPA: DUF6622 family protein [Pararobbsia sp.]|jgi:hypothetical protein|nr:DUF6622 family protein [Pararobbsia sp.]